MANRIAGNTLAGVELGGSGAVVRGARNTLESNGLESGAEGSAYADADADADDVEAELVRASEAMRVARVQSA